MARVVRTWHPLGIVIGASVAACFVKPDPPGAALHDAGAADMAGDASGGSGSCVADEFTALNMPGCGTWGLQTSPSTNVNNGLLTLTAPMSSSTVVKASCQSQPQTFVSATLEIDSLPLASDFERTRFLFTSSGLRFGAVLNRPSSAAPVIAVECNGSPVQSMMWTSNTGRYVRLTSTASGVSVEMAGVTDGSPFTPVGMCPIAIPQTRPPAAMGSATLELEVERGSGGSAIEGKFASLIVCN